MTRAYLGLGSNLGDPAANMESAMRQLRTAAGILSLERSALYRTAPVGMTDQDWFVNAVVRVETTLGPRELLERCLEVEQALKRTRSKRWGPRTMDIDILLYGNLRIQGDELEIPHPRMTERAFVLAPLADLAPEMMLESKSVAQWLAVCGDQAIEKLEG